MGDSIHFAFQSADSTYSIVFPQAKQATDTIYIKLLNNPAPGTRKMEIQMLDNITAEFDVDIFSTAYRRPVEIRQLYGSCTMVVQQLFDCIQWLNAKFLCALCLPMLKIVK